MYMALQVYKPFVTPRSGDTFVIIGEILQRFISIENHYKLSVRAKYIKVHNNRVKIKKLISGLRIETDETCIDIDDFDLEKLKRYLR